MSEDKGDSAAEEQKDADDSIEKNDGQEAKPGEKQDWEKLAKENEAKFNDQKTRAEKAESELKKREKDNQPKREAQAGDYSDLESRVNLKVDLRMAGYTQDQIGFAETYAKGLGKSLTDIVKAKDNKLTFDNEYLQSAIASQNQKKKAAQQTTAPSSRSSAAKTATDYKNTKKEDRANEFSFEAWKNKRNG